MSLVCSYLSLYISFLLFGYLINQIIIFFLILNVQIIKRKYIVYKDKYKHTRETDYSVYLFICPSLSTADRLLSCQWHSEGAHSLKYYIYWYICYCDLKKYLCIAFIIFNYFLMKLS